MTFPEEDLPNLQGEVQRLLGQSLLWLQAIERLTMTIVETHQLSAPTADLAVDC